MIEERMTRVETQMKDLVGNGRPGRIERLENRTDLHSKLIYIGYGIVIFVQFAAANGWLKIGH